MVVSQAQCRGELGSGVTERSDRSRSRTHVAREGFVLPGEGKQRQANQQHRWQQPKTSSLKTGMEGMGQPQPEAEPHRQWQQQSVDAYQQQTAGPGRKANGSLSNFDRIEMRHLRFQERDATEKGTATC